MSGSRARAVWTTALLLMPALSPAASSGGETPLTAADYDRAAAMLQPQELLYNESLTPNYLPDSDRFWYRSDDPDGARFWLVDPLASTNRKRPAFDHERLAANLSALRDEPVSPLALPFESIDLSEPGRVGFELEEESSRVTYDCATSGLDCRRSTGENPAPGEQAPPPELLSPDGSRALRMREHDLYLVDKTSGEETRLTTDGEPYYDYASQPESRTSAVSEELAGTQRPPSALWSRDGSKIVTYRLDQRNVGSMYVIQTTDLGDSHRPILHDFRFPIPGDEGVALSELLIIDVERATLLPVATEPAYTPYVSLIDFGQVFLGEAGEHAYLLRRTRGSRTMALEEIALETGKTRAILSETSQYLLEPNLSIGAPPNIRVLASGEVIWYSQRDGWGHLYLYDREGELVRQVTRGAWVVRDLLRVDEEERRLYFTAAGLKPEDDPYLRRLYTVSLDQSSDSPEPLTDELADHTVTFSPTGRTLVDVYSRVDQPTRSRVLSATGKVLVELEQADFSRLTELGVDLPTPFVVKARDGKTDLYGTLLFPPGYEQSAEGASYPVIDGIYPGPQAGRVTRNWHEGPGFLRRDLALAQLGFIVMSVDGLGTPYRSKAFHNHSQGNLQDAGGLPDHLAAFRQLAARYPGMDLDRVGIYGHSGGGFAAARAIFTYPEFYKVAVASAGNHDQRGYLQLWGENYQGDPEKVSYEEQSNASIAHRLEGKLLLAYGAMDDNVSQALTLQVIDALTRANKDYDLIVMPRGNHTFSSDPYFIRRLWDYFVRHLAKREPPSRYRLDVPYP